jgi:type I restriction enzyme M protein
VKAIGHDKRGGVVYRRNEDGEELLEPAEGRGDAILERSAGGVPTSRPLPRRKVVADDTPLIAAEFLEWKRGAVLGW